MTDRPALHIVFTMDCDVVALKRSARDVPHSWEQSARAIEGYCNRLLAAGFPPTLFVSHEAAAEHTPLLEELAGRGVELGLLLHPPMMELGRFSRNLGEYDAEEQRLIADYAAERFADAIGVRPRSVRSGKHSANDATFKVLYDLGFRQGSISRPGWDVPRFAARWHGAHPDAHYVHPADRLRPGDLPFFELPLSTDPSHRFLDGMPIELTVDSGAVDAVHRPVIEARLAAMEAGALAFRALCLSTSSRPDYYADTDQHTRTLEALIDELGALSSQYTIVPTTLAGAHERFRRTRIED
ncbi:MAG TPA: hypothetical protein VNL77_17205 [Roseiflexaceae bacterium]|nr:hypothetical protein [Roseiflexaceae bacterium]